MSTAAIVVFTGRSTERMLSEGGSSAWALDPRHARRCEYVVCARNSRAEFTKPGPEDHGSAFLVARIKDIVPAHEPKEPGRFLIAFSEHAHIDIPKAWKGWRNPVRYTNLEEIGDDGIDPATLEWKPMPEAGRPVQPTEPATSGNGLRPLTIAEAKRGLAEAFGVSVDAVEITIRG
jgi:hypothetical protein